LSPFYCKFIQVSADENYPNRTQFEEIIAKNKRATLFHDSVYMDEIFSLITATSQ